MRQVHAQAHGVQVLWWRGSMFEELHSFPCLCEPSRKGMIGRRFKPCPLKVKRESALRSQGLVGQGITPTGLSRREAAY